jgi:hypothetical protein
MRIMRRRTYARHEGEDARMSGDQQDICMSCEEEDTRQDTRLS